MSDRSLISSTIILALLKDARSSRTAYPLMAAIFVNSKMEMAEKEAVLAYSGVISRQIPRDCDKCHNRAVRIISTATVIRE